MQGYRLYIELVYELNEAAQLTCRIEAGPDQAVLDDGETNGVINFSCIIDIVIAIVHDLDLLSLDCDAGDASIPWQPNYDRLQFARLHHALNMVICVLWLSLVWRRRIAHVLGPVELEEAPIPGIDEEQGTAFEVEELGELALESVTESRMLLLAHELTDYIYT